MDGDPVRIDAEYLYRSAREVTQCLDDLVGKVAQVRYGGSGNVDSERLDKATTHLKAAVDALHSAQVELMSARLG